MSNSLGRRQVLAVAGAALLAGALDGCAGAMLRAPDYRPRRDALQLPRLRADTGRITAITVCTRPFRAEGPRLDVEAVGDRTVVHNYGHGGSGWSLAWGSSFIAMGKAMATGEHDVAVIGCGALGLTSGLLLQRAGARVTIYAKELPPNVRSSLASGIWSPDSRICLERHATPAFKRSWEGMARQSFRTYQSLLGLPGAPVEYFDMYAVFNTPPANRRDDAAGGDRPPFAKLEHELIPDLTPPRVELAPGTHPFGNRSVIRRTWMMFNLNAYMRMLESDFRANGGTIEVTEFGTPADFTRLRQKTLVNATGYGARALFNDRSVTPVRGQLARMIPQADIGYGLFYKDTSFIPRRDGMVFQVLGDSDYYGFDDDTTAPDRAEAEHAVQTIAELYA